MSNFTHKIYFLLFFFTCCLLSGRSLIYSLFRNHFSYVLSYVLPMIWHNMLIFLSIFLIFKWWRQPFNRFRSEPSFFRSSSASPVVSPDLHTSPRGLITRLSFPEAPAGPSTSSRRSCAILVNLFVQAPFRRLTVLLFTRTKRNRSTEIRSLDPSERT